MKSADQWVHDHRAEWSFKKTSQWIRPGERVLNLGAGDCRLDLLLKNRAGCDMVPVDVESHNETTLALTLYDGKSLPFSDQSVDVVLLLWVLHHAEDPRAVLSEAHRVARRAVIVFEDRNDSVMDRMIFRAFHRFLRWSQGFSLPHHEWTHDQWSRLGQKVGFKTASEGVIGRQLGYFASCSIGFVWEPIHSK
jgi:ubiquinone/menaquinone biosynthesis C-methylase UbiE